MPKIIPIKDLKNTSKVSDMCHETTEPIYITKNGYGDMVLMSMESYEDMFYMQKVYQDIALSEKQIAEGKTRDFKELMKDLEEKYDL